MFANDSKKAGSDTTQSNTRTNTGGGLTDNSSRVNMSLDYGRQVTKETVFSRALASRNADLSSWNSYNSKIENQVVNPSDYLLKPRQEEYNENIYDSLMKAIQDHMSRITKSKVF